MQQTCVRPEPESMEGNYTGIKEGNGKLWMWGELLNTSLLGTTIVGVKWDRLKHGAKVNALSER